MLLLSIIYRLLSKAEVVFDKTDYETAGRDIHGLMHLVKGTLLRPRRCRKCGANSPPAIAPRFYESKSVCTLYFVLCA